MIIKKLPEDFIVKETTSIDFSVEGKYAYYLLRKKNYNTLDALMKVSQVLKLDLKLFGYAGNKDKRAITEQYISIRGVKFKELKLKDLELSLVGRGDKAIQLGDLKGNEFEIVVRDLKDKKKGKIEWMINYFDEQRFGTDNMEIGKKILSGDTKMLEYLPKTLSMLYIHSFQSYVWNKVVESYLNKRKNHQIEYSYGSFLFPIRKPHNKKIPLVGYLTKFKDLELRDLTWKFLDEQHVKLSDFIIPGYPKISMEGDDRDLIVNIKNFKLEYEEDDMNPGNYKALLKFSLPKGAYATLVIKRFFK